MAWHHPNNRILCERLHDRQLLSFKGKFMEILWVVLGLIIGSVSAFLVQRYRMAAQYVPRERVEGLETQVQEFEVDQAQKEEQIRNLDAGLREAKEGLTYSQSHEKDLRDKLARVETERTNSESRIKEQKEEFHKVKEQLKTDFKNLAHSILEENSAKFAKQNQTSLDSLLKPLSEKIKEFKQKVETTHETQTRDGVALREKIKQLTELNLKMSEEANNLTNALKGQSKTMGNWGELVLETILENSGLIKGEEYLIQGSFNTEAGKRAQPDVIINLPDSKHLVIDSKVSLVAYERYCSAPEQDATRDGHLKDHILSIRTHINGLSQKSYQDLHQISAPDFVMMFIPLDPALILALQHDRKLFVEAFEKGIFLVCPATLLFALRTIATLWKREKQNANALEIARRGGALYDKFVGFYEQLETLGACIRRTQESYDDSMSKLKTGRGNLVRQVEMIKNLGAKASKSLPDVSDDEENSL